MRHPSRIRRRRQRCIAAPAQGQAQPSCVLGWSEQQDPPAMRVVHATAQQGHAVSKSAKAAAHPRYPALVVVTAPAEASQLPYDDVRVLQQHGCWQAFRSLLRGLDRGRERGDAAQKRCRMGQGERAQPRQPTPRPGDADGDRSFKVQRRPNRHSEVEASFLEANMHPVSDVGPRCSAAPEADRTGSMRLSAGRSRKRARPQSGMPCHDVEQPCGNHDRDRHAPASPGKTGSAHLGGAAPDAYRPASTTPRTMTA